MVFCDWSLPLNTIFSRFIHDVTVIKIYFLFIAKQYFILWLYYFFLSIPVDGYFDCFHFGGIIDNAAMNICAQTFVQTYVFMFILNMNMYGNSPVVQLELGAFTA